uniref:VWFA domain-containing protein n=1 Tax=viral metagenome TaxID=1070528 RepID=A0A6C0J6J7_9ZZZZ
MSATTQTCVPNFTYIAGLLDTSGSMASMNTAELAQGAENLVKDQCKEGFKVKFTGARFSDKFDFFAENIEGNDVKITPDMITPNGATALVPSFARMIRHTEETLSKMEFTPGNVVFILLSDGEQTVDYLRNGDESDVPYTDANGGEKRLKELITKYQDEVGWKFFFLGMTGGIDAVKTGAKFGIASGTCMNYQSTTKGAQSAMRSASNGIMRSQMGMDYEFTDGERENSAEGVIPHTLSEP